MKRYLCAILALFCLAGLTACGKKEAAAPVAAEDEVVVTVVCKDKGVNQIGYTSYIGGAYRTTGRGIELDGNSASGCTLEFRFSQEDFLEGDDISQFSIALSPYGKGSEEEIATTEPVPVSMEYGKVYTITLSSDGEAGFNAILL
ncbi:MAG: hypothetical protein HFF44_01900 [Lawsonibacter sp.]|nr:hypothetical protein [Lawsonibacter sp.]